jgi:branched-subunit amino acid aminotransferase/4-amino-4-deoxychorismate lyase
MRLDGDPATLGEIKALALTNYGHFTSMLVDEGGVRGLSLHMQRLARDCQCLFGVELDVDHVRHCVRRALTADRLPTVARITVFDPTLDLGSIGRDANPRVLVTTRPAAQDPPRPLRLQAVSYQRENPAVKHIGLFGALQRRREAQREGFDDVLFLNRDGTISEIATSNIGFVRDGKVIWPRSEYLAGITMTLLQQASDEPTTLTPLTLHDLATMDAAFATNAAVGIRSISSIDDTRWPTGHPALSELSDLYADIPPEPL